MPILRYFTSCMSRSKAPDHGSNLKRNFDDEQIDIFLITEIPKSIHELLIYIAREGVAVTDLFRRPGNTQHIRRVIRQLKEGENIDWTKYNFYTLANIAKRYLLQIDQGILGTDVEHQLILTLELPDDQIRIEAMSKILELLSDDVRHLLALLFGTWFRMIYHSEVNAMSVEAVAKSVAGSIFPSCTVDPNLVNKASKVMEYLITGFASSELFGRSLIEYFTDSTQTSISRIEKFKYEFIYPRNVSKKKSTRLFVRMLLEESSKHGFDLLKNEVTEEEFNTIDNCTRLSDECLDEIFSPASAVEGGDSKTRKRRLSKTLSHCQPPISHTTSHNDQVQQMSEKRTCITASSTDVGLTTTSSTLEFDVSQECIHVKTYGLDESQSNCHDAQNIPSTSPKDNRKNRRLDLNDFRMEDIIKSEINKSFSELKKMQDDMKNEENASYKSQNGVAVGGRFSRVKKQQLERLQKRSDWFLSPPAGCKTDTLIQLSPTSLYTKEPQLSISSDVGTTLADRDNGIIRSTRLSDSCAHADRESDDRRPSDVNQIIFNTTSLSDPQLSQPNTGDQCNVVSTTLGCNTALFNTQRESSLSEEEVEVRYFVVRKYYGPVTLNGKHNHIEV